MKAHLHEKNAYFLRSHKLRMTYDFKKCYAYKVTCCKEYILELAFEKNENLRSFCVLPESEPDDCFYHSHCIMTEKSRIRLDRTEYIVLSFHKLAKCPCIHFVCVSGQRSGLASFHWRSPIPISVDSANMITLPQLSETWT
jgi:hypothetical protein